MDDIISDSHQSQSVREILVGKHPGSAPAAPDILLQEEAGNVSSIYFASVNGELIKRTALSLHGSAGPSGLDADAWRRLCTCYKGASTDLREAVACFTRLICTDSVPSGSLTPYTACRLIALNKNPGVRPIGVCEVFRRLCSKAALFLMKPDIMQACGPVQACTGIPAGVEAMVHSMTAAFASEKAEAVLLVDARNAFNSLNRRAALHNIARVCPPLAQITLNTYQDPASLFVRGGQSLLSQEGTTQGDPLAMAIYATALTPLVKSVGTNVADVCQGWFADDSAAAGGLSPLRKWYNLLKEEGQKYGYNINETKTQLLVKPGFESLAAETFGDTTIHVKSRGVQYLGAAIGTEAFLGEFKETKVEEWAKHTEILANYAASEPHAAYSALTHGLVNRWNYVFRTMAVSAEDLAPLERELHSSLLPELVGQPSVPLKDIDILKLPTRDGGMALPDLTTRPRFEHQGSKQVSGPMVKEVLGDFAKDSDPISLAGDVPASADTADRGGASPTPTMTATEVQPREVAGNSNPGPDVAADVAGAGTPFQRMIDEMRHKKRVVHTENRERAKAARNKIVDTSDEMTKRRIEEHTEKGSSSWLSVLPLAEHGFRLTKRDFRDALALRYAWPLANTPATCVCGELFSVEHQLCCARGGFPTLRHNEIRDLLARELTEICTAVSTEPALQPLSGERFPLRSTNRREDARLDIAARGFWTRGEEAFFDVRVFCPDAPSYGSRTLPALYQQHERRKWNEYGPRVTNVERAAFTPLVFSVHGGCGRLCNVFLKRLCQMQAESSGSHYSQVIGLLRCRLSFALLRAAVLCIRGARSRYHHPARCFHDVSIAVAESGLVC